MQRRYYFIEGPITIPETQGTMMVGYIRLVVANGRKHIAITKSTQELDAIGQPRPVFNSHEQHSDFDQNTSDADAIKMAMSVAFGEDWEHNFIVTHHPHFD